MASLTGRVALTADPAIMQRSGQVLIVAELALDAGFKGINGRQPRSLRGI